MHSAGAGDVFQNLAEHAMLIRVRKILDWQTGQGDRTEGQNESCMRDEGQTAPQSGTGRLGTQRQDVQHMQEEEEMYKLSHATRLMTCAHHVLLK